MPELPEVETIARGLKRRLPGRRVLFARLRYKSLYRRGSLRVSWLVGRTIDDVERVGKNVVLRLRPSGIMLVNLGMTGRLIAWPVSGTQRDLAAKHLHCRIRLDGERQLRYYDARRFGHFYIAEHCDFEKDLGIGPDPFVATPSYLRSALGRREAPIKPLLLDQRIISGIGNIYADEALFLAGVDPRTPARLAVQSARRILTSTRTVMRRAITHGGSTLRDYRKHDGSSGAYQRFHAVYGREGDRCIQCGSAIRKIILAGRGTHFCMNCQTKAG